MTAADLSAGVVRGSELLQQNLHSNSQPRNTRQVLGHRLVIAQSQNDDRPPTQAKSARVATTWSTPCLVASNLVTLASPVRPPPRTGTGSRRRVTLPFPSRWESRLAGLCLARHVQQRVRPLRCAEAVEVSRPKSIGWAVRGLIGVFRSLLGKAGPFGRTLLTRDLRHHLDC
jgi:hypothetical protein